MGQTSVKFTGDPDQLLAAYNKLIAANVKLQEQGANAARQSKRQHNEAVAAVNRQVASLAQMATGYLSVQNAIGAVTRAYDEWNRHLQDVAASARSINAELVKQVVLAGETGKLGQIEQLVARMPGVTRAQATAAYAGVAEGHPMLADKIGLAAQVARLAPTGVDLAQLGERAGLLASADPSLSPERAVDRAMAVQSSLGRAADRFFSARSFGQVRDLTALGMGEDEALAFAISAAREDAAGLPRALAAAASKRYERPKPTAGMDRAQFEAQRQLAAASDPAEIARLIRSHPAVAREALGDELAAKLARLSPENLADALSVVQGEAGESERVLGALEASDAGRRAIASQHVAAQADVRRGSAEQRARDREVLRELFEAEQVHQGLLAGGWRRIMFNTMLDDEVMQGLGPFGDLGQRAAELRNYESGYERFGPGGYLSPEARRRDAADDAIVRELQGLRADLQRGPAAVTNINER